MACIKGNAEEKKVQKPVKPRRELIFIVASSSSSSSSSSSNKPERRVGKEKEDP